MTKIGYQDGIKGFVAWLRKQPGVQQRGPGYDPADLSTWPWPDKLERTLRILKDENDAKVPTDPGDTDPPPPPPAKLLAARTYNKVLPDGSDARFCKHSPGVTIHGDGSFDDAENHYSEAGRHETGPRDPNYQVPGLRLANNMNSQEPCQGYTEAGRTFPPWPSESYQ